VAGSLTTTNKLLSVLPLRARYTPEIGDLVIGRITSVQTSRYLVQISAPHLSSLPLSSINLPGGVLRKRTTTDSLHMRSYFSEGDLVAAEVQTLHSDGSAGLHTRSLRYGKLRNGAFVAVAGGVARGRRQVFDLGDLVEVFLGVNGYIFVAWRGGRGVSGSSGGGVSRLNNEDAVLSAATYSSQNDEIPVAARWEIARVVGVVRALVEGGVKVDEEAVKRGYEVCVEEDWGGYLGGGEMGKRIVERVVEG
jgi:exosome complex component RRP4